MYTLSLNNTYSMKRTSKILIGLLATTLCFVSCNKDKDKPEQSFDASNMVGKWVNGSEFYRYDNTYSEFIPELKDTVILVNGCTWDTADDVTEEEASPFVWTLSGSQLTHVHIMRMYGNTDPKAYTMITLTGNTLAYKDNYGQTFSYTRVQ